MYSIVVDDYSENILKKINNNVVNSRKMVVVLFDISFIEKCLFNVEDGVYNILDLCVFDYEVLIKYEVCKKLYLEILFLYIKCLNGKLLLFFDDVNCVLVLFIWFIRNIDESM